MCCIRANMLNVSPPLYEGWGSHKWGVGGCSDPQDSPPESTPKHEHHLDGKCMI